jgi:DNA replication protein DnaC
MADGAKNMGDILAEWRPQELPEQDIECPKHGTYRGKPFKGFGPKRHGDSVSYPECPKCVEERKEKEREQAMVEEKERQIQRWDSMNIGKKFWSESLETFNAYTPELAEHHKTAKEFAENPIGKLVMLGEHGTGKTHLAASILKVVGGVMYRAYEVGMLLRQTYNGTSNEYEFLTELCKTPLLVIDELEKIKDSEAKQHWLSYVVGKRYDNMLPIIFIANCHTQEDCQAEKKPCPKCIEYHLENDVLSRIIEDGKTMKFTGEDYREKIREANNA